MQTRILTATLLIGSLLLWSCDSDPKTENNSGTGSGSNTESEVKTPENGDLNNTFNNEETSTTKELTPEEKMQQEKNDLISKGWKEEDIANGQLPVCYNFQPKKGSIDNYLDVSVGSGTDVVIKVVNLKSEKCIRYVFIRSGTKYSIRNIQEGRYYLKIAYGKDWLSRVENGKCIGKFIRNPLYEKGEDVLDFNLIHKVGGYSVPSFSLELDVVSNDILNSFNSANIDESEFNN